MSFEMIAPTQEFTTELRCIIKFAVIDHGKRMFPSLANHRLLASLGVNDNKPTVTESSTGRKPVTFCIWSPRCKCLSHTDQSFFLKGEITSPIYKTNDTTHNHSSCLLIHISEPTRLGMIS